MNEFLTLIFVFVAGILLGIFFFGGLWWTINKGLSSKKPALWFFSSLFFRTGIVIICFYFIAGNHWERLLISFLGFFIARFIAKQFVNTAKEKNYVS